jgi:Phosphotransferase enzyme family
VLPVPRSWSAITPAWMSAALSRHVPGTVVATVDVGPVRGGTNSRARIGLTYARGSGPPAVFVKGPGSAGNRLALLALGALAVEARLAESGVPLPLAHPRPFGGGVDWHRLATVVVMEDVTASGAVPGDGLAPLGVDDVRSGLAGLARLHAAYRDGRRPPALQFLRPWRLGPGWAAVSVASLARGLRRLARLGTPEGVGEAGGARVLGGQFARSAVLAATGPRAVLHGDPHPGNTYRLPDGRTGFLDWQLARTGHWSHDVGYFLAGSLEVEDRRRHERDLLAGYLDELAGAGAPAVGWEEAWDRYRATPAFGLATWVHTLAFGSFQPAEVCVATIRRFAAAYADLDTGRSLVAG